MQEGKLDKYFFSSENQKIALFDQRYAHQELESIACPLHCNSWHEQEVNLIV